jgi:threonine/homoserine/homoserine lactone efflux protein
MPIVFLLKGFGVGILIAVPVGPIGVLCIHRSLAHGRLFGLLSGLGAATADACYGFIAAFGLTFVSDALLSHHRWLHAAGGVFLCTWGVRTLLSKPATSVPTTACPARDLFGAYASALLLTLANPLTALVFMAIFAGLGLAQAGASYVSALALVLGVFAGSAAWWVLLSVWGGWLRSRMSAQRMRWLIAVSGALLAVFGTYELSRVFG